MNDFIRLESMTIEGIKNVEYGHLAFNEMNKVDKGEFNDFHAVLGIYGQNGSGKTTAIEAAHLLKIVLSGEQLPLDMHQIISNEKEKARIECTFFMNFQSTNYLLTYVFMIEKIDNQEAHYDIVYEKMTVKEYRDKKWLRMRMLFEVDHNEIVFGLLRKKLTKEQYMSLKVAKEIAVGSSFFFNNRNLNYVCSLFGEDDLLVKFLSSLNVYARVNLIIIDNDLMGSVLLKSAMPINIYLLDNKALKYGKIMINLLEQNELNEDVFNELEKVISQIDIVMNAIIPTLNIEIYNKKEQLMNDGQKGYNFEVVSKRNGQYIPLRYESEGIKRIISITSSLIAMYNNPSVCLMIDEFDSGIFEYLLGELVEIIFESAKGQFLFTSHNLRVLEKLPYQSIILTTVNPYNRYIRFNGVKSNNNVRDFYYTGIMLGGQKEVLYDETKNYQIKRAFRKAGKINE